MTPDQLRELDARIAEARGWKTNPPDPTAAGEVVEALERFTKAMEAVPHPRASHARGGGYSRSRHTKILSSVVEDLIEADRSGRAALLPRPRRQVMSKPADKRDEVDSLLETLSRQYFSPEEQGALERLGALARQPAPTPRSGEVEEKIERVLGVGSYGPGRELVSHVRWKPMHNRPECVSYCPRCGLARRMREEFGHGE